MLVVRRLSICWPLRSDTALKPMLLMCLLLLVQASMACGEAPAAAALDHPRDAARPPEVSADLLETGEVWHLELPGAGVSSPRTMEIDGDGVLDIVLGVGKEHNWGAIVALSGVDGSELWRHELRDEVYATPCLVQVDGDGVPDIVCGRRVGSRSGLVAISGSTGEKLWGLHASNPDVEFSLQHFNTCIPCPDVDGDGREDILALQGGGDDNARVSSWMYVLKSDTGRVLASAETPDGAESFFVPCLEQQPDGRARLLIATGGETLPGHVFSVGFPGFEEHWRFPSGGKKGFVAGGLMHDFDGEGRDAVVSAFNSVISRIDGDTGQPVWQQRFKRCETYVTPTLGHFGGDDTLDVVSLFSEGRWPNYNTRNILVWMDGTTGEILDQHDRGVQASSTPVVFDMNNDGRDEVLLVNNLAFSTDKKTVPCQLDLFDGGPGKTLLATRGFMGYSAATPWIGHLDDDAVMDVVFVHLNNVYRIDLAPVPAERIHWNEYRGSNQDGIVARH